VIPDRSHDATNSATTLKAQRARKRDPIGVDRRPFDRVFPPGWNVVGSAPAAAFTDSAALKIAVLGVIVAAILATRMGPRDR
jgi:hypothetical protein